MDTWGFELSQLVSGCMSLLLKGYRSGQGQGRIQLVNVAQDELKGDGRQGRPRKAWVRDKEYKRVHPCFLPALQSPLVWEGSLSQVFPSEGVCHDGCDTFLLRCLWHLFALLLLMGQRREEVSRNQMMRKRADGKCVKSGDTTQG